ncbi:MAG: DUF4168 domain-containing protein [Magnetospirillum sp.]|nr:DUF4168 domain-containing protein [Magnetospirillum sp.]
MTLPALPAAVLAIALAFGFCPAAAETAGNAPPPGAGAGDHALDPPPDDHELQNFVTAFVRLIGVQHGYMMMMEGEDDPVRLAEMKRHAVEDMTAAVQKDGMSVARYNAIAQALQNDRKLQGRVEAILHQMADKPDADDGGKK